MLIPRKTRPPRNNPGLDAFPEPRNTPLPLPIRHLAVRPPIRHTLALRLVFPHPRCSAAPPHPAARVLQRARPGLAAEIQTTSDYPRRDGPDPGHRGVQPTGSSTCPLPPALGAPNPLETAPPTFRAVDASSAHRNEGPPDRVRYPPPVRVPRLRDHQLRRPGNVGLPPLPRVRRLDARANPAWPPHAGHTDRSSVARARTEAASCARHGR
ncbi:hypothetical protein DFH09DRAFT_1173482, partial [Mycena vulgaris]